MPYTQYDSLDDYLNESDSESDLPAQPPGGFEYESAEARFKREELSPVAKVVVDALMAVGATAFRVRYDGGYDEGFGNPDLVHFGDSRKSIEEVTETLSTDSFVAQVREAAARKTMWGNRESVYGKVSNQEVVAHAFDELAQDLAYKLLGDGFGTGEYQLYGEFTADFATGELVDHEGVEKPIDRME